MTKEKKKDKKARAKILRKPIHDRATRKVSTLPELLKKSERPDGEKADALETPPPTAEVPAEKAPATDGLGLEVSVDDGGLFDALFSDVEDS